MFTIAICGAVLSTRTAAALPPGFIKTTIALNAPPVGLAFDNEGVLYALEGAAFGSNVATLRTILPDGTFGNSYPVAGDDPDNFFVGSMAFDHVADRLLISDNTGDGRLYAVSKSGVQQTVATEVVGIAGIAVRKSGEIFVSTSPFGSDGQVLEVDRADGSAHPVLDSLGFGAGLAFDMDGDLIVQDANSSTFLGRLQQLPITTGPGGLEFDSPVTLLEGMQSSAGVATDAHGALFTTGSGGLYRTDGSALVEMPFDNNGSGSQFATAIALDPGSLPFEGFAGAAGGRLAYMADFGFANQDSFVTLIAPASPGDYNLDGEVDEMDYTAWQVAFGTMSDLSADGNLDGMIDAADYVVWRKSIASQELQDSAVTPKAVPEPSTILPMALLMLVAMTAPGRSRPRAMAESGRAPARPTA